MTRVPDVLDLLAQARPARLDPPDRDGPDRDGHAARAVADIVAGAPESHEGAAPHRRRRPARRRLAVLGSAALTAAAAVTAVAVVVAGPAPRSVTPDAGSGRAPDSAPDSAAAPVDAGRLLLAAAERNEQAAPAAGRYLTIQSEYGFAAPVEAPDGRYTMFGRTASSYWLARSRADRSWVTSQWIGAIPATPADEAAWRRHGSPALVRTTKPKPADLNTAPGQVSGNTVDPAHLFALGDRNVSQAELDALPTDPAALREALLRRFDGGGSDMPTDRDQWLLTVATSVVTELTVSNAVRAAAYRMLATMPGVRGLGAVRDMHGRPGQAVAYLQDNSAIGSFEVRLIIDPDTGRALGSERRAVQPRGPWAWIAPGAVSTYEVVLVWTTTDDNPPKVDVTN